MATSTEVHTHGPLFDGEASVILDRYILQARQDVADEGITRVHHHLGEVLRHNTGRYESRIHRERRVDSDIITDTPVVYGPWLEGVGSRNSPKTRFPGYKTFRLVSQGLDTDAGDIAERTLHDGHYLEELNA